MAVPTLHYSIHPQFRNIATLRMGKNMLGGNEALKFTETMREMTKQKVKIVIVNLEEVKMINSSGLGMLVGGLSSLKKHNIDMVLVSVPKKVMDLLEMTHLDKVFKIYDNADQAVKNFI